LYLGQFVREARRRAGFSQRTLAQRGGISQPHVARIEGGSVDVSFELVRRLVRACGFDLSVRLTEIDDSNWSVAQGNRRMSIDERARANQNMVESAFEAAAHRARG
jgi:transcriptional regulator with XRE-family HTH domain